MNWYKAYKVALNNYSDPENAEVGFDFNGQFIVNPWMDETGRFEFTTEEAIEHYGMENIEKFVEMSSI